jgi:TonB family protein
MSSFPAIRRLALSCAVTVICALAPALTAGADERNLLANPDFEAPRGDHPWMPAAWDTSRGNTEMVFFGRDAFSAHSGQSGVSVANASQNLAAVGPSTSALGADGSGTLTSFAVPKGGYQMKPTYPESARRAGIEGTSLLRFEITEGGMVSKITVEKSAGHEELDRAAIAAVQKWRFEPARRGAQAVAVWVTLPVRFELKH